jgi:hypothetical protein
MNNKAIHISDVRTFRSCRRKWSWSSPLQGNLEPVVPYLPFFTGKALHAALEYYYRDGIPFEDTVDTYLASEEANMTEITTLWPSEQSALEEQIDLIRDLINHYAMWQRQDKRKYSDSNLEFISLEMPFELPLPIPKGVIHPTLGIPSNEHGHPTIKVAGRLDGIVRHRITGDYWIWETKTTRSISELTESLANDEQSALYMWAAERVMRVPIKGVLYNMLRKKAPAEPKILQSGAFSQAKNVDTTSYYYLDAIKRAFPDWSNETIIDEYGEILNILLDNDGKFFSRFPLYHSATEVTSTLENIYYTAMEMVNPNLPLYPAPSWLNCNFCFFKSPCLAKNAGSDYTVLLDEEYQVKTHNISLRPEAE